MATKISFSKAVAEEMKRTKGDFVYMQTGIKLGCICIRFGATSENGKAEINYKVRLDGEATPMMAYYQMEEFAAAVGNGPTVEIVVDGETVTVNGIALNEVEPPALFHAHEDLLSAQTEVYNGDRGAVTEDAIALVGKETYDLFPSGAIKITTSAEGSTISGCPGDGVLLRVIKVRPKPVAEETQLEEMSPAEIEEMEALFDKAIQNGAEKFSDIQTEEEPEPEEEPVKEEVKAEEPVAAEPVKEEAKAETEETADVPFEGSTVVTEEAKKETKKESAKAVKETKKKEEATMEEPKERVLKLLDGERVAFIAETKSLSVALGDMVAVAPGAKVSLALKGGQNGVMLCAYKEPVQAQFIVNVEAVSGETTLVAVDLDNLNVLVRNLVGIEDELRFGVCDNRINVTGSETKFNLPLVDAESIVSLKDVGEGIRCALYPTSIASALRASVCTTKGAKSSNTYTEDLLFTITEEGDKVQVYTCDNNTASRAVFKGRALNKPEDARFTIPTVIRNIKWPESDTPINFRFGEKMLGIEIEEPRRAYIIRYKEATFPKIENFFNRPEEEGTQIILHESELKKRVSWMCLANTESKPKLILEVEGSKVQLFDGKDKDKHIIIGTFGKTTGPSVKLCLDPSLWLRGAAAFEPEENLFTTFYGPNKQFYMTNKEGWLTMLQMPASLK